MPENADNKSVTWTSSNTEIATINQNGLVTAIKEGTATITVTTQDGGKVATCIVNVEPAVPYITMVTQKNIGEDIRFVIKVANEADKTDVWIDLNNNGKKDTDEDKVVFLNKDKITHQDYSSYRLQSQTITLYGKVTSLYCGGNQLTQLDVSKNTQLRYLNCGYNQLTQLDVSINTQLIYLFCIGNQLTSLDISKNTQLIDLKCGNNQLTQLDVSKNTQLIRLACVGNQLTQLDVSKNTQLIELSCGKNQLTQLDVSKNTKLTFLSCEDNRLTQLDVSKNTELGFLYCHTNQLTQEAMDRLIDNLPTKNNVGRAYLIDNKDGTDGNYQFITNAQKQKAKNKNWRLYANDNHINP